MGEGGNRLIGRERESARLAELVRAAPVVTLTGPGGVGKTTLARDAAESLAPELADGVKWVDLTVLEPGGDVALAAAAALGARDVTREDAAERLAELLADRELLLVLDNCEHVTEAAAEIAALAASAAARVLATSRETLGAPGEHVLLLEPLGLPGDDTLRGVTGSHAARLFAARAAAVRDGFRLDDHNAADVARLCRGVDGLPLALELAAARSRSMSPGEIADRLEERFSLLTRRKGTADRRHASLRAAVDWSYGLLSEGERLLFDRMGVFSSGAGAVAVEEICGAAPIGDGEVLDLLDALVDRSLVTTRDAPGRTLYGMLETLRGYARERLSERGELEPLREHHADRCADWADRMTVTTSLSWSWDGIGFSSLSEFGEPMAALRWCLANDGAPDRALRLLRPLWVVVHSVAAAEVTELAEQALARWDCAAHPLGASALGVAATGHFVLGRPDLARERALAAIELEEDGAPALIARRALALEAYHFDPDVEAAARLLTECSELAQAQGATYVALEMSVLRAQALAAIGESEAGTELAAAILARAEEAGSPHMCGWTGYILGTILLHSGDTAGARARFEKSLATARSVDFPLTIGVSLRQLGVVAALEGEHDRAVELIGAALDHFRRAGDRAQMWDALRSAAVALAAQGQRDVAARLLAAADGAPGARAVPPLERGLVDGARSGAVTDGERAGTLDSLAALAVERLAAGADQAPPDAAPAPGAGAVFRRDGDLWTLAYRDATVRLPHLKGLTDIAALLAAPGREVHCLELAGEAGPAPTGGDLGEVMDARARDEYRARIEELRSEIEDARRAHDPVRAERAQNELGAIAAALESAYGLGGRVRRTGDPAERARTAVAWRIRNAVRKIEAEHPALARHLRNAVRTGTWCAYEPETPMDWEL
ncbi:MAG: AAA family ATPase [Thermoleophilaceae bacterium]